PPPHPPPSPSPTLFRSSVGIVPPHADSTQSHQCHRVHAARRDRGRAVQVLDHDRNRAVGGATIAELSVGIIAPGPHVTSPREREDRKSTRLNSSHEWIS